MKSSQKDKVRQFIAFTQTGEKSAINCLGAHDWKLDVAVDNFFQNPDRYSSEPRSSADKKKLDALWQRYRGINLYFTGQLCICGCTSSNFLKTVFIVLYSQVQRYTVVVITEY